MLDNLLANYNEKKKEGGRAGAAVQLGLVVVAIQTVILLTYNGYRVFHVLNQTTPTGFELLAAAGLFGVTLGAVIWSVVAMYATENHWQDAISFSMWVVNFLVEMLAAGVDMVMGLAGSDVPNIVRVSTVVLLGLVISLNIAAGFVYHFVSDHVTQHRRQRKSDAAHRVKTAQANDLLRDRELDISKSKEILDRREQVLKLEEQEMDRALNISEREAKVRARLAGLNKEYANGNGQNKAHAEETRKDFQ